MLVKCVGENCIVCSWNNQHTISYVFTNILFYQHTFTNIRRTALKSTVWFYLYIPIQQLVRLELWDMKFSFHYQGISLSRRFKLIRLVNFKVWQIIVFVNQWLFIVDMKTVNANTIFSSSKQFETIIFNVYLIHIDAILENRWFDLKTEMAFSD